jgi:hypothetical protein
MSGCCCTACAGSAACPLRGAYLPELCTSDPALAEARVAFFCGALAPHVARARGSFVISATALSSACPVPRPSSDFLRAVLASAPRELVRPLPSTSIPASSFPLSPSSLSSLASSALVWAGLAHSTPPSAAPSPHHPSSSSSSSDGVGGAGGDDEFLLPQLLRSVGDDVSRAVGLRWASSPASLSGLPPALLLHPHPAGAAAESSDVDGDSFPLSLARLLAAEPPLAFLQEGGGTALRRAATHHLLPDLVARGLALLLDAHQATTTSPAAARAVVFLSGVAIAASASTSTAAAAEAPLALLALRAQRAVLRARLRHLDARRDSLQAEAVRLHARRRDAECKAVLRRRLLLDGEAQGLHTRLGNVDRLFFALADARSALDHVEAMRSATAALKGLTEATPLEAVERAMEEAEEAARDAEELGEALARPLFGEGEGGGEGEDDMAELIAQFEALETSGAPPAAGALSPRRTEESGGRGAAPAPSVAPAPGPASSPGPAARGAAPLPA